MFIKLIVCYTAYTGFIIFEKFIKEVDYLPDKAHKAFFMAVTGTIASFAFATVFTIVTYVIVTCCGFLITIVGMTAFTHISCIAFGIACRFNNLKNEI